MPEKANTTITEAPADPTLDLDNDVAKTKGFGLVAPNKGMRGSLSEILLNALFIVLPMVIFSGVLLGLVLHYRLEHSKQQIQEFDMDEVVSERNVFYVDYSATRLIFIASWSSTLAPVLVASIVNLWSFPAAQRLHILSSTRDTKLLPTPYQLALTIKLLNGGGISALWDWLKYIYCWESRSAQGAALVSAVTTSIAATVLSLIVIGADTWLHVAVQTVPFTKNEPLYGSALPRYSFHLSRDCAVGNNSYAYAKLATKNEKYPQCTIYWDTTRRQYNLLDEQPQLQVLSNTSDTAIIKVYPGTVPYAYLAVPNTTGLDYTASSYAVQTKCHPIISQDSVTSTIFGDIFNYTRAFHGELVPGTFDFKYFVDVALRDSGAIIYGVDNPYYVGWSAVLNTAGGRSLLEWDRIFDPYIIKPQVGGMAVVLQCSVAFYDVHYENINGTVNKFSPSPSNHTISTTAMTTFRASGKMTYGYLFSAATYATLGNSAQDIADSMALSYSMAVMSMFSGAVATGPASQAQRREIVLVARVPAAPLFALLAANMLFAVAGAILLYFSLSARGEGVREVQARMTVEGLVADHFEGARGKLPAQKFEDLFAESIGEHAVRIGVGKAELGGFEFQRRYDHEDAMLG